MRFLIKYFRTGNFLILVFTMTNPQLFKKIFKEITFDKDISESIKPITNQYPYFGLAHLFTLSNTLKHNPAYVEIAAKTALFYTNNFYLQAQLANTNHLSVTDKIEKTETEIIVEKEELLFEPLHASDYFASQGIKLSEDALGADKLGKQLKSFTAWLKTMKKVHPDKLPPVNKVTETAVQNQAEKSNLEEEIVTEAMAEAYILQNKQAKAIDIYNKLSLLNPAKSAYFATKIESLKK